MRRKDHRGQSFLRTLPQRPAALPDSSHDRKRKTACSRFRRGRKAGGPAAAAEATGAGLDHRRRGRRSERHRELFAGRRAVRLRHAVVGVLHAAAHDRIQIVSARIGRVTGHGLAANIRQHYPGSLLYAVISLLLVANTLNLAADLSATPEAMTLVNG